MEEIVVAVDFQRLMPGVVDTVTSLNYAELDPYEFLATVIQDYPYQPHDLPRSGLAGCLNLLKMGNSIEIFEADKRVVESLYYHLAREVTTTLTSLGLDQQVPEFAHVTDNGIAFISYPTS